MFQVTQKSVIIEGEMKTVYGIQSKEISIDDISPNFDKVSKIADILNKEKPSDLHVLEIVEDFLAMSDF